MNNPSAETDFQLKSAARPRQSRLKTLLGLLTLTAVALAVHGYHLGVEDASIYLPAIKKNLDPALYPFNDEFFLVQTRPALFDELVAWSITLTHLPVDLTIFIWHLLTLIGFLWATLRLARICFDDTAAQWSAVMMITALITMPVAGTKLYIFQQYLHPRSISAVTIILAAVALLESRRWLAACWIGLTFLVHPLMAFFGGVWLVLLSWPPWKKLSHGSLLLAFPFAKYFESTSPAWREAMDTRDHYFIVENWTWYMWLGAVAPLGILYGFAKVAERAGYRMAARLSARTALFGLLFLAGGLLMDLPIMIRFAATQPMRALHLVYYVMLVLAGGFLGRYLLRDRIWRWLVLYVPLCVGLYIPQRALFATGEHIEWPLAESRNSWLQAYSWIRHNTPKDAIFALAPHALDQSGADFHGFRGLAERSMLADYTKDAGLSVFSVELANTWQKQVHSLDGWEQFSAADFHRRREKYNVTWVMVARGHPAKLDCPYQNNAVRVCRVE
ncbi:MAG: DUF2029 domain-containing protein [Acidobacteriales bacterium]|nr:DUF2029 domain-containing protein [Terriglobales bacterium]